MIWVFFAPAISWIQYFDFSRLWKLALPETTKQYFLVFLSLCRTLSAVVPREILQNVPLGLRKSCCNFLHLLSYLTSGLFFPISSQVASIHWGDRKYTDIVKVEVWDVVDHGKPRPFTRGLKFKNSDDQVSERSLSIKYWKIGHLLLAEQ